MQKRKTVKLANWTNFPIHDSEIFEPTFQSEVSNFVVGKQELITRGNGRCYGDASLNDAVLSTLRLNNILSFDQESGQINVQSGILLSDILEFTVPKGWFLPVTPGTKFITIGGALASNVHGKNHHKDGSISKHVLAFELLGADDIVHTITAQSNAELFELTMGGLGLTGVILSAVIQLKKIESSYIDGLNIKAKNLKDIFELFEKYQGYTYSVAWIDCYQSGASLGRSILMLGEHTLEAALATGKNQLVPSSKPKFVIPFYLPSWILNGLTIKTFNFLFYYKQFRRSSTSRIHYENFFYPLDAILEWNRLYGKTGFLQYQFVLPMTTSFDGLTLILNKINKSGFGSFLAVLKQFGPKDNEFSFPIEGYTLALDFPIRKGLFEFLDELDRDVQHFGGRIYLSKDARMSPKIYQETYGKDHEHAKAQLSKYDALGKFKSLLSKRLGIH